MIGVLSSNPSGFLIHGRGNLTGIPSRRLTVFQDLSIPRWAQQIQLDSDWNALNIIEPLQLFWMVKVLVAIKLTIVNSSFKRHYPSFGSNKKSSSKFLPQSALTAHGAKGVAVYPQQFWKQRDTIVTTSIPDACKTAKPKTLPLRHRATLRHWGPKQSGHLYVTDS